MEAFDTNVVVRLIVRDDESVVLVELSWVLRVAYKFDRATTAAALRWLLGTIGVQVEDPATTQLAFEAGAADFVDYFILESARVGQRCRSVRSTSD